MAANYIADRCGFVTTTEDVLAHMNVCGVAPQTMTELKALLAQCLNMPAHAIADDVYLPDLGLDSIRLMQLAEQWQKQGVSYLTLLQNPTPIGWLNILQQCEL